MVSTAFVKTMVQTQFSQTGQKVRLFGEKVPSKHFARTNRLAIKIQLWCKEINSKGVTHKNGSGYMCSSTGSRVAFPLVCKAAERGKKKK